MKILILSFVFLFVGCTKNGSVTPIQDAGCQAEQLMTAAAASVVASSLTCSGAAAIQTSLQQALGNANYCASSTAASTQVKTTALQAKVAQPQGAIATLVCPLAVNVVVGYLSSSVPSAWGCSGSADAGVLGSALSVACLAIPY
jgi:hypothetical protein